MLREAIRAGPSHSTPRSGRRGLFGNYLANHLAVGRGSGRRDRRRSQELAGSQPIPILEVREGGLAELMAAQPCQKRQTMSVTAEEGHS